MTDFSLNSPQGETIVLGTPDTVQLTITPVPTVEISLSGGFAGAQGLPGADGTHWYTAAEYATAEEVPDPNEDDIWLDSDGQMYIYNAENEIWEAGFNLGGGVSDHGELTGLEDDDHTQYHNDERGDIRYYTKDEVDTSLSGKADTSHTHAQSDITNLTSDLALKAPLASPTFTGTVSGVTKSMVGLGNVDNTSDANKPVSTAQQTAIDAKVADAINDGTTTVAPSQNAVYDALANKQPLDSDLTTIAGLTATTDSFLQAKSNAWAARTVAQVKTDLGLTGTNSGDQTSIVGITGTKAQFNTAVTDGDISYLDSSDTITGVKTFNAGKLLDKGSRVFDIRTYGALVDGSTDDTTAVQNAIDAASTATGGIVFFPAGVTKVTSSITLKSHVSLVGVNGGWNSSTGSVIKTTATTGDMLSYSSSTTGLKNVSIENLRIEGPGSGTGNGIRLQNTGGTNKPNISFQLKNVKVQGFPGGAGIEVACTITSNWDNVVSESNATGFYLNGGSAFAAVNTSLSLTNCYANGCTTTGFNIRSTVYSTLHGTAADDCGTAYLIDTCNNVTLNSPGSEWNNPTTASPADGFKITGSHQIVLNAPYTFQNKHYSFWVTGSSSKIILIGPSENTPVSATNSFKSDSGSYSTIIAMDFTTARSDAGTTSYLDDGAGGMTLPSYAYITGNVTAAAQLEVGTKARPSSDDGAPLGDTTHNWSDLFLATGALINFANSNVVLTHSSGILTMGTGEMRITTPGTNAASVITQGSTNTLTNKTIDGGSNTITGLTNSSLSTGATAIGGAYQDWTANPTGFSSTTINDTRYKQVGKTVFCRASFSGTSNATTFTFSLPTTSVNDGQTNYYLARGKDSAGSNTTVMIQIPANSSTATVYSTIGGGAWTASGTKILDGASFFYETA